MSSLLGSRVDLDARGLQPVPGPNSFNQTQRLQFPHSGYPGNPVQLLRSVSSLPVVPRPTLANWGVQNHPLLQTPQPATGENSKGGFKNHPKYNPKGPPTLPPDWGSKQQALEQQWLPKLPPAPPDQDEEESQIRERFSFPQIPGPDEAARTTGFVAGTAALAQPAPSPLGPTTTLADIFRSIENQSNQALAPAPPGENPFVTRLNRLGPPTYEARIHRTPVTVGNTYFDSPPETATRNYVFSVPADRAEFGTVPTTYQALRHRLPPAEPDQYQMGETNQPHSARRQRGNFHPSGQLPQIDHNFPTGFVPSTPEINTASFSQARSPPPPILAGRPVDVDVTPANAPELGSISDRDYLNQGQVEPGYGPSDIRYYYSKGLAQPRNSLQTELPGGQASNVASAPGAIPGGSSPHAIIPASQPRSPQPPKEVASSSVAPPTDQSIGLLGKGKGPDSPPDSPPDYPPPDPPAVGVPQLVEVFGLPNKGLRPVNSSTNIGLAKRAEEVKNMLIYNYNVHPSTFEGLSDQQIINRGRKELKSHYITELIRYGYKYKDLINKTYDDIVILRAKYPDP